MEIWFRFIETPFCSAILNLESVTDNPIWTYKMTFSPAKALVNVEKQWSVQTRPGGRVDRFISISVRFQPGNV